MYTHGESERLLGRAFGHQREKVILASKIVGPGMKWVRGGKARIDRKNIYEALENSLKRLQTDYIDLYQLHWPNRGTYHFRNKEALYQAVLERLLIDFSKPIIIFF